MKTPLTIAAALLLLIPAPGNAQSQAADEGQIQAIVAEQVAAWNTGDAVAFSKSFAPPE